MRALRAIAAAAALAAGVGAPARAGEPPAPLELVREGGGPAWLGPAPAGPARRIVTLAPSLTDVLLAMGLRDRIVGVTRVDAAPEVASVARVGTYVEPNPEAILGLRPDLVLWTVNRASLPAVQRLAQLARGSSHPFSILAVPAGSVADALAAPALVGQAVGAPEAGRALQASMRAGVARFRERARRLPRRRVLFLVGRQPLVVAGPGSFADELIRLAGCENVVASGPQWPVYPLEKAVAADPDLVIDAAVDEPASSVALLSVIPAVRRGARHALRSEALLHPGPRMVQGLEELLVALQAGDR